MEKKGQKTFVEVKNVTLFRNKDTAEFPDAPTTRGIKHLLTLIDAIKKSYKTYLIFLVQIQNMKYFKIAKDIVTAHCPNTGSMKGLLDEGNEVYLLPNNDPKRKLKYGLEIIKSRKNLVGVNTHIANRIVEHGLNNNLINELKNNDSIKAEVFFNKETRFDFLLEKKTKNLC